MEQRYTPIVPRPSNFASPRRTVQRFAEAETVANGYPIIMHENLMRTRQKQQMRLQPLTTGMSDE